VFYQLESQWRLRKSLVATESKWLLWKSMVGMENIGHWLVCKGTDYYLKALLLKRSIVAIESIWLLCKAFVAM
jgi:hypothetical protein